MASEKDRTASDSEDSEEFVVKPSGSCHHTRVRIEEILYEMELARYFKKLQENRENLRKASRFKRSVSCQTDPEISGIPPSWILVIDKSANELYTGLGNTINSIFHSSEGYSKGKKAGGPCQKLEYFRYVDGHLESRLLPGIKMPESALPGMNLKRELESLMEKAWKLTMISGAAIAALNNSGIKLEEISEAASEDANKQSRDVPCCSRMKIPQAEALQKDVHPRKFLDGIGAFKYLPGSTCVAESGLKAQSGSNISSVNGAGEKFRKPPAANVYSDEPTSSGLSNGIGVKCERKPLAENVRTDGPSTSGLSRRVGGGQENPLPARRQVNFIRKNILATKTAVIRNRGKGGRRL